MEPRSNVTYFVLLGLIQNPKEQKVLSVMFLLVYILTVVGNLLIVVHPSRHRACPLLEMRPRRWP